MFKKTFVYDPTENGKFTLFEGYCKSASGISDPHLLDLAPIKEDIAPGLIFHSSLCRAKESAKLLSAIYQCETKEKNLLNEIKFQLADFMTSAQFEKERSMLVRKLFIEYFVNDQLPESREELKKRFTDLLDELYKLPDGTYLAISHSFFMKLFKIYLRDKKLFMFPARLRAYLDIDQRTFEFGEGFTLEI